MTDLPLGYGEWEESRVTQNLLEELSGYHLLKWGTQEQVQIHERAC